MREREKAGGSLRTQLLEGEERKVSVVTDLNLATDTGTGGYVKHQESDACAGRAISGDGQTTAVPVKAGQGNTVRLPQSSMHHQTALCDLAFSTNMGMKFFEQRI